MSLIKIEGKALEKLVEVVSQGIGTLYKPRAIRKEADAEAYKNEVLAKAEAKKTLIEGEAKIELIERAKARLVNQEINRQTNLEEIAEKSIPYLETNVSDQPVDEDWRTRFFNKAQDVSSDEMQEIWAKILAGEVSRPGQFSFRTLEIISNLSKNEAEKFQNVCSLASSKSLIWKIKLLDSCGLGYGDLMLLREAGLIHDNDNLVKIFQVIPQIGSAIIPIGNDFYQIRNKKNPSIKEFKFNQIAFTIAGTELCRIVSSEPNLDFHQKLIEHRMSEGYELTKIETKTTDNRVDGREHYGLD